MIVFTNPGEIDVRSISTFGVSVKEGSNPIGFFGTGLKYAIAVLLRTGHGITVCSGETIYHFDVEVSDVRGKDFEFVTISKNNESPVSIGFTTELGKQWDLWMAYREIACNCKDECGEASFASYSPDAEAGFTKIIVSGDAFEAVYADRHLYILDDEPAMTLGTMEVRMRPSYDYFYRGVRVHNFGARALYTYNELAKIDLTEDRTVADQYSIKHKIARGLLKCTDKQTLRSILLADENTFEHQLDFHGWGCAPSEQFIEVVGSLVGDRMCKVNQTAMQVWKDHTKKSFVPREIALTGIQKISIDRALDFVETIGFNIRDSYPIKFVETMGDGILGLAQDGTIYIAERVFHMGGTKQLASTLIEEYLHLKHGWKDCSREMQSFLFEKLVSVGEELIGVPL
jgi:hypothetical protein